MAILGGNLFSRLRGKSNAAQPAYADPMSSLKHATRWVENLPLGDVFKSQQAITREIKRFNEGEKVRGLDQLEALIQLDETARDLQDTLLRQYLRNPRMAREVESQLWYAIHALYWELLHGYRAFVLAHAQRSGRCAYERLLPLAALRALVHYGALMKWRAVRYLQADERLWQRLNALYAAIEQLGLHQRALHAYPGDTLLRTPETVFGNILMLDLADSGVYYPRQIDLVDRWLAHWNHSYAFRSQTSEPTTDFVIDLSCDHGPRRARRPTDTLTQRYWNTEPLLRQVRNAREQIREGASPASLGLSEDARSGECQTLFESLLRQWSGENRRDQRRSPRHQVKRMIEVAHGLAPVLEVIEGVDDAEAHISQVYSEASDLQVYGFVTRRTSAASAAPDQSARIERWVMHDESACGFGATVEAQHQDWLRVGVLVAVRPREQGIWQAGVLRRLVRSGDAFSVGIDLLGESAVSVLLADGVQGDGYTVAGDGHRTLARRQEALLITHANGVRTLIIDPVCFQPERIWTSPFPGGVQRVKIGQPLQHGEGWMEVSFQTL